MPTVWLLNGDERTATEGPATGDGDYVVRPGEGDHPGEELALGRLVDSGQPLLQLEWLGRFSSQVLPSAAADAMSKDPGLHELPGQPELLAAVREVDTALRNVGG